MTTDDDYRPPRAPPGLGAAGRKLWRAVVRAFQLRADELIVLEAAARLADELAAMQTVLAVAPPLIRGSKGQLRSNPVYSEARGHRLALGRLLAQLGLTEADGDAGLGRSTAGRRLARLRWNGGNHG